MVATEQYVQVIRPWTGLPPGQPDATHADTLARRKLTSDLLLVYEADGPWHLHRDVLDVDGVEVSGRDARLRALFVDPNVGTRERLRRMTLDSARYNLGDITRTLNTPTFPFIVVHPAHRDRFRRVGALRRDGDRQVREMTFEEVQRPTLVQSAKGRDVPLRGRLLVDDETGQFVHARVDARPLGVTSRIEVWFEQVPGLALRAPTRMWEWYRVEGDVRVTLPERGTDTGRVFRRAYIEAVATYSDFRRYGVVVDESVAPSPR